MGINNKVQTPSVAKTALTVMGVGLTAGIALIAMAKKVGDKYFTASEEGEANEEHADEGKTKKNVNTKAIENGMDDVIDIAVKDIDDALKDLK